MDNLFTDLPATLPDEITELLIQGSGIRIERIISKGHQSKADFWYDQDEHEWVTLLQGEARIQFAEEELSLSAGDHLLIPAHNKHRVSWTHPDKETIWLAIYTSHALDEIK